MQHEIRHAYTTIAPHECLPSAIRFSFRSPSQLSLNFFRRVPTILIGSTLSVIMKPTSFVLGALSLLSGVLAWTTLSKPLLEKIKDRMVEGALLRYANNSYLRRCLLFNLHR